MLEICQFAGVLSTVVLSLPFYCVCTHIGRKEKALLWERFLLFERLFPIKDNFTGGPATHSVEAFLEVIHFEVVSNNWRQI